MGKFINKKQVNYAIIAKIFLGVNDSVWASTSQ